MVFREHTYGVLVVSSSEKFNSTMKTLLPMTDYWPLDFAGSVSEARRRMLETEYDLVLINAPLPDDFGTRLTVSKPAPLQVVRQSLSVLCATRERLRRMEARQASVEEKIEEIRLVNRAKWLLIERLGMTEAEAHRYMEKQAMDQRVSKRGLAEIIIKTYE